MTRKQTTRLRPPRAPAHVRADGDPDPAPLLAAVLATMAATRTMQGAGPRRLCDVESALCLPRHTLGKRLRGLRPLSWEVAERVAEAVGLALADVYPARQGAAAPDSQEGC